MKLNKAVVLMFVISVLLVLTSCGENKNIRQIESTLDLHHEKIENAFQGYEVPPKIAAVDRDGNEVDILKKGSATVLTIGTTWCPDCQIEYSILQTLQEEFHSQGVEFVVLIAVDGEKQTREKAVQYFSEKKLTLPIYFVDNKEVRDLYRIEFIPTTMIIDKTGHCIELGKDKEGSPRYYFIEGGTISDFKSAISEALQR